MAAASSASAGRSSRAGFTPPRGAAEKDQLIRALVHDNEVLMKEVAELDAQLQSAVAERDALTSANAGLLAERQERETMSQVSERLLRSMEAQVSMVRAERDEHSRQHDADRAALREIFGQLEAQLAAARAEREELHARADRERRLASKRIHDLERSLAAATAAEAKTREAAERDKESLRKQFEQRVHGMRLDKEQASVDKALLRRLERELAGEIAASMSDARAHARPGL